MKLLVGLFAVAIAMIMVVPVSAVQIIFTDKLDDDMPPLSTSYGESNYTQDANFELSKTVMILDASIDRNEESYKNSYLLAGFVMIGIGVVAAALGIMGGWLSGGTSFIFIFAGVSLMTGGIAIISSTALGGGQSVSIEAYDATSGELRPAPNVIPIITGGTKEGFGAWGFSDARTGDRMRLITNQDGKTPKVVSEGYTIFAKTNFKVTMDGADDNADMRFTSSTPNGGVRQFVMNEATSSAFTNFDKLLQIVALPKETVRSLSYMNNSELENAYDMTYQDKATKSGVLEAPSNLLTASHIVEFKIIIIVYRKSADYRNMTDGAILAKGLSDIPYLPRIRETCDYYLNTVAQGNMMPFNDIKSNDGNQISSSQDNAYGFVDYMVDTGNNHVHPVDQISVSNSMAYVLIWGRYEGHADDGLMTTNWARYHIAVHDNDNNVDYHAQPVAVCLDNGNIQKVGGYPSAVQAYVVVMLNYTPIPEGSAFGRSLEIDAQLKEISALTYHTFWRDNVSLHPIKLRVDMAGQAGKVGDDQPISPFQTDWIDYETWDEHISPHRNYVTLRTNDEWIPMTFCAAYIDQSVSRATLTFYLCPDGASPIGGKSPDMMWKVHDVTVNITLAGMNQSLTIHNFGDASVHIYDKYTQSFSTSGLTLPAVVNISLNATFYWDAHITSHVNALHRVNITAFGMMPIQENYDNFMGMFGTDISILESALNTYPIAQSSLNTIKTMIQSYCDARAYIQTQIDTVKAKAEGKNSMYARFEVEKAQGYFGGNTDNEKNTMYVGTCDLKYRNNIDQLTDMTDPFAVGGYNHVAYNLIYTHFYIFEHLNMAMLYVNAQGNYTKYQYALYAVFLKNKATEDPVGGGPDYVKKIDWSLVVAVIAIILAIISTIILYKISKEKQIIPSHWMTGWRFALVVVIFCGIACLCYLIYWNVGLLVAKSLNAYCSIGGWFT